MLLARELVVFDLELGQPACNKTLPQGKQPFRWAALLRGIPLVLLVQLLCCCCSWCRRWCWAVLLRLAYSSMCSGMVA